MSKLTSIKPVTQVTTPEAVASSFVLTIVSAILFQNPKVAAQFYTAPTADAPADPAAARAEFMYNDLESNVRGSAMFSALIEAQTGFKVRDFNQVSHLDWKVGMVVTPAQPVYRPRSDDGYEMGKLYFVTNQTVGLGRSVEDAKADSVKASKQPMSRLNDEWTLISDVDAITALTSALVEGRGIQFVEDVLVDKGSGKSLEAIVREYLSD